ncbi:MAG: glycine cleavage T C-terminal barrel domain-containing protein [Vicinamibacteria bacterium]
MTSADAYRSARGACALAELPDRAVLAATGPKRQPFLHGMLSNDVAALVPGRGCLSSLMDVKGRLLCFFRILMAPDALLLEMPADRLDFVTRTLEHYRVAAPVRFAARPFAIFGLLGPQAPDALRAAGVAVVPTDREAHVAATIAGHEVRVVRAGDLPADGFVVYAPPDGAPDVRAAFGAPVLDRATLDVLRVEDGRAWYGPDVTDENLLFETGLVREYHVPKGCYVGQEVVARLEARGGNVNKLLRGLTLSEPAAAGAIVRAEGQDAGRVTTAGVSPRLGPVAMAYVHRRAFEPGTAVEVDGRPATVVALPFLQAR